MNKYQRWRNKKNLKVTLVTESMRDLLKSGTLGKTIAESCDKIVLDYQVK